ncbi:MAG: hypothetical protein JO257_20030 [Deltaproteobacteria bacterium]|nr:hypothetical protein [Deltaproteobacteria bacterium]
MPFATALAIGVAGCARGTAPDKATADAAADAKPDAAPDTAPVALDAPADALPDAGCPISAGMTIALTGSNDLARYPAAQQMTPGAMLGTDAAALSWDTQRLYITVQSTAFAQAYEPLHIYVEAADALAPPIAATGKEYSGLVPQLPFTPTHLIAVRRVSDAGTGAYDAVFTPASQWTTRAMPLADGTDVFAAQGAISVQVPWTALGGCPHALRLAMHVVHAQPANEWKDLVPATTTPWVAPGGDYLELDLTGAIGWGTLR